jgi:hypothetical protein
MPVKDLLGPRCQRGDHHLLQRSLTVAASQAHQADIAQNRVQPPSDHFGVTQQQELMTTGPGANKDLVGAFVTAWNDRDFKRFDELMGGRRGAARRRRGRVMRPGRNARHC